MAGAAESETGIQMASLQGIFAIRRRLWPKPTYWYAGRIVQIWVLTVCLGLCAGGPATARTQRIVAFGDSLSAGYQLPGAASFPAVLERQLKAAGFDVTVDNASVSGDTTSAALERLDWALGDKADLVIVELGANDMLRGIDPALTRRTLADIIRRIKAKGSRVLLAGMLAAPGMGKDYEQAFAAIFPDLAREFDVPLYPFFLDGVAGQAGLQLADGMHPNAAGVEVIARGIRPMVEAALKPVAAKP
jgi:acyl-CoA thioesterase-1